ncbi:hypothetical protein D3C79_990860 [compost metagenome]
MHGRILDNPLQTLLRIINVQRHIGSTRLHHREEGHDHLDGPLQSDPHGDFRTGTKADEMMSQTVGTVLQLRIAQLLVGADDRQRIGA